MYLFSDLISLVPNTFPLAIFLSFRLAHMGILWLSPVRAIVHVDLASKQIYVPRVNGIISWIIAPTGFLQFDFSERSDTSAEFLNSFIHENLLVAKYFFTTKALICNVGDWYAWQHITSFFLCNIIFEMLFIIPIIAWHYIKNYLQGGFFFFFSHPRTCKRLNQ